MNYKGYWLCVEPYVFVSVKGDDVLFYNTLDGKALEFQGVLSISRLARRLLHPRNLYVVSISDRDRQDKDVAHLIGDLREHFMADLHAQEGHEKKPLPLKPIYKITRDVARLRQSSDLSLGEGIYRYLRCVSLYITQACGLSCSFCDRAFRQFPFCTSAKEGRAMDDQTITRVLGEIPLENGCHIDLLGGNILTHPRLEWVIEGVLSRSATPYLHVHVYHLSRNLAWIGRLAGKGGRWQVKVGFPIDIEEIRKVDEAALAVGEPAEYDFVVQTEAELSAVIDCTERLNLSNVQMKPLFNGHNKGFFQEFLFLSKEEILDQKPSPRELFMRGQVNGGSFGELSVCTDGRVYADLNLSSLGRVGEQTLGQMLCKELRTHRSWLRTRGRVQPCQNCLYERLCPPLSRYEQVLGRNNLCVDVMTQQTRGSGEQTQSGIN